MFVRPTLSKHLSVCPNPTIFIPPTPEGRGNGCRRHSAAYLRVFIKFWEKIPPTFLFHPIFLLEFDKKTDIFGKFFRISFSSAKCHELSAVPLKFETEFLK